MSDNKIVGNFYNSETASNILSTVLFVTGTVLHKEGYSVKDIEELLTSIGFLSTDVLMGNAKITDSGIVQLTKTNVVDINHIQTND